MNSLLRRGRTWRLEDPPDPELVRRIAAQLNCHEAFASVLARRGGDEWPQLLDPDRERLHPATALLDMDRAVARVARAIASQERIFVHGDFDVDGLTGAAVLFNALSALLPKGHVKVEVGERQRGHGLSRQFVHRAIEERFGLVITADCGVSNHEEIGWLRDAGIDTVVTDHHVPPPALPAAAAVVNPQRADETYPNRHLAGVGVAFKLACALYQHLGRPIPWEMLDLVAVGTIADLVPLSEGAEVENRAIVREGFDLIAGDRGSSLGLRGLMDSLGIDRRKLSAATVGYSIAPKLNAANRAGDPKVAFLLLTTGRAERAKYLSEVLLDYNRDREIAQGDLILQARGMIRARGLSPRETGMVFLVGKYWNEGILGLAASSLVDQYNVPAVIVSRGDAVSRGSCRSIDGVDILACLEDQRDLLLQYGGHEMAAGFSVGNENLEELEARLAKALSGRAEERPRRGPGVIAARAGIDELDMRFYTNIRSLSPYGSGNPAPLFLMEDCRFSRLSLVGSRQQHVKGAVTQGQGSVPFIAFRMGRHIPTLEAARGAGVVFRAGFDSWRSRVQLEVVDIVGFP
jgi:single-stranded-DNA-specific exonuclease